MAADGRRNSTSCPMLWPLVYGAGATREQLRQRRHGRRYAARTAGHGEELRAGDASYAAQCIGRIAVEVWHVGPGRTAAQHGG